MNESVSVFIIDKPSVIVICACVYVFVFWPRYFRYFRLSGLLPVVLPTHARLRSRQRHQRGELLVGGAIHKREWYILYMMYVRYVWQGYTTYVYIYDICVIRPFHFSVRSSNLIHFHWYLLYILVVSYYVLLYLSRLTNACKQTQANAWMQRLLERPEVKRGVTVCGRVGKPWLEKKEKSKL